MKIVMEDLIGNNLLKSPAELKKWNPNDQAKYVMRYDKDWLKYLDLGKITDPAVKGALMLKFPQLCDRWNMFDVNEGCQIDLLCKYPEKIRQFKHKDLAKLDWGELLSRAPELSSHCDFSKLDKKAWIHLLRCRATFIPRFKEVVKTADWGSDHDVWLQVLHYRPELYKNAPKKKLEHFGKGIQLMLSLEVPGLFDIKPKDLSLADWRYLFSLDTFNQSSVPSWLSRELVRLASRLEWPNRKHRRIGSWMSDWEKDRKKLGHKRTVGGILPLTIDEVGLWIRYDGMRSMKCSEKPTVTSGRYALLMPMPESCERFGNGTGVVFGSCDLSVRRNMVDRKFPFTITIGQISIYSNPIVWTNPIDRRPIGSTIDHHAKFCHGSERMSREIDAPELTVIEAPSALKRRIRMAESTATLNDNSCWDCRIRLGDGRVLVIPWAVDAPTGILRFEVDPPESVSLLTKEKKKRK